MVSLLLKLIRRTISQCFHDRAFLFSIITAYENGDISGFYFIDNYTEDFLLTNEDNKPVSSPIDLPLSMTGTS